MTFMHDVALGKTEAGKSKTGKKRGLARSAGRERSGQPRRRFVGGHFHLRRSASSNAPRQSGPRPDAPFADGKRDRRLSDDQYLVRWVRRSGGRSKRGPSGRRQSPPLASSP